jgi:hypothetical protein
LIDRQWRTIASAILFTAVLLAGSAILFGVDNWHAYVTVIMPFQREVMLDWEGVMLVMMPTVLTGLRLLGVEAQTALAWQIAFSLACLPVVVYALWKLRGPQYQGPAALVLTGGTIVVTPYAFNYDMGALAAVAAILFARSVSANHGAGNSRSLILAAACLVLCMLPLALVLMGQAGIPLAPILIATCLLIYRRGEGLFPPHAAVFPGSTAR